MKGSNTEISTMSQSKVFLKVTKKSNVIGKYDTVLKFNKM